MCGLQYDPMDASQPPADKSPEPMPAAPKVLDYQAAPKRPLGAWIVFMRWVGVGGFLLVPGVTQLMMWTRWHMLGFYMVEAMGVAGLGLAVVSLVQIDNSRQFPRRRNALIFGAGLTFIWACIAVLLGMTFIVR